MTDRADGFSIDRFIHEPVRLMILTRLAASDERQIRFNDLKDGLQLSAGNLSVQLRNLEDAGFVKVEKTIENRRTLTRVSLTKQGYADFMRYLDDLESMIRAIRE